MAKKKSLTLPLITLLLGFFAGVGVVQFKAFVVNQIMSGIRSEAQKACNCKVNFGDVSLSLIRMRAIAKDVELIEDGATKLTFKEMIAGYSLRDILSFKLWLSIDLVGGKSIGVLTDSATYRLIKQMVTPLPPEEEYFGHIKCDLDMLRVINGSADQVLGSGTASTLLRGDGFSLTVVRKPDTDFYFDGTINALTLMPPAQESIPLGSLATKLILRDNVFEITKATLTQGDNQFTSEVLFQRKAPFEVSGKATYTLNSELLHNAALGDFGIIGSAILSGTVDKMVVSAPFTQRHSKTATSGTATTDIASPFVIGDGLIEFKELKGTIGGFFSIHDYDFALSELTAKGDNATLTLTSPLTASKRSGYSGELTFKQRELSSSPLALSDLTTTLTLSGKENGPIVNVTGAINKGSLYSAQLPALQFDFKKAEESFGLQFRSAKGDPTSIEGNALLQINKQGTLFLSKGALTFTQLPIADSIVSSGAIEAHGPLLGDALRAEGTIALFALTKREDDPRGSLTKTPLVESKVVFQKNELSIKAENTDKSLLIDAKVPLLGKTAATLSFEAKQYKDLGLLVPICPQFSAKGNYQFSPQRPLGGEGKIALSALSIGCTPYITTLAAPTEARISGGILSLVPTTLKVSDETILVSGTLSSAKGLAAKVVGDLDLVALTPYVPQIDDLQGSAKIALSFAGSPFAPVTTGSLQLSHGGMVVNDADLALLNLNGAIDITGDLLTITGLTGTLNDGAIAMQGEYSLSNPKRRSITLTAQDIAISPSEGTSALLSTALTLKPSATAPAIIAGTVTIESGEIKQDVQLTNLLSAIPKALFSKIQATGFKSRSNGAGELPPFELAINVKAERDLFFVAPWAEMEFSSNLSVVGTLDKPLVSGSLELLSGRMIIKDRPFEITSGQITFSGGSNIPQLQLTSEGAVRSLTGEDMLVLIEARGPITNPKIVLSSDRGLSQAEILTLLTTRGRSVDRTRVNRGGFMSGRDFSDPDQAQSTTLMRLLSELTRIDSFSLEPTLNPFTGLIEPKLIAEKRLHDRLRLTGETSLEQSNSTSRAKLILDIGNYQSVAAIVETLNGEQNSAVGFDFTQTILAERHAPVSITLKGDDILSKSELLRAMRISQTVPIALSTLPSAKERAEQFLRDSGFANGTVSVRCRNEEDPCKSLAIDLVEGPQLTISKVSFSAESPAFLTPSLLKDFIDEPATVLHARRAEHLVTQKLRSEGYIAARVRGEFITNSDGVTSTLSFAVISGRPVTFEFVGNTVFTPAELLTSIDLFGRKHPFGANTISILVNNIERLYRERGYLFATIQYTREERAEDGRTYYHITIEEGVRERVSHVVFKNNDSISQDHLIELYGERFPKLLTQLTHPRYAVQEQIDTVAVGLEQIYDEQGFSQASVKGVIVPDENEGGGKNGSVTIEYTINEGSPFGVYEIVISGLPSSLIPPEIPKPPSVPAVNRLILSTTELLHNYGYRKPSITTDLSESGSQLTLNVTAGKQTFISTIEVIGLTTIPESTVRDTITIKMGDPWGEEAVARSRSKLLALGLFSHVTMLSSVNGKDPSKETLTIKVTERTLTTFEMGGGINSAYGFHLFGETTDRSFFNDGRLLGARVDGYYDPKIQDISQGLANLRYLDPSVISERYSHTEDIRYQKFDLQTYEFDLDRLSLSSALNSTENGGFRYALGHTIARDDLSNVNPEVILSDLDSGLVTLSFITATFNYDRRDDPLLPEKGYNLRLEYRGSAQAIGSDANFNRVEGKASYLLPLPMISDRYSFATSVSGGGGWEYGDASTLPITQRFYLGGRNSVRGFRENSLGPRAQDGAILGGDSMVAFSNELRYLTFDTVSTHIFLDAGNVYLKNYDSGYQGMRYSTGVGMRFLSPVGPIGFDIGHPLNEKSGEPSVRFDFDIGTRF